MAKKAETKETFAEVMKGLEKAYGKGTVVNFKEKPSYTYDIIPTGSIAIDHEVLGIGGFAKTKLYLLKGWKGANKSTLCATLSANCQAQGGKILYVDFEKATDTSYFTALGVDFNETFFLCQPDDFEQGVDVILKLLGTGEIDLLIIDSDSAGLPKSMMEADVSQVFIGKKAKCNSEQYPKIKNAIHKHNVCAVVIAQYRINPGQMFGDNRVIPGGQSLGYYADCEMELFKTLKKDGDETGGTITRIKTEKNKMFLPYREKTFPTTFGVGIDFIEELIDYCNKYKLFRKYGETITYNEVKYPLNEFYGMIYDNPEFKEELRAKVIEKIKNPEVIEEVVEDGE